MAKFTHSPEIELVVARCFACGRFYAAEEARTSMCPYCARASIDRAHKMADENARRAAAARGAATRAKKRAKGPA